MDIIYYLLREFRYIFKSRKIKKYLTIIIIYMLFLFLLSAFSVSKATDEFTYNNISYSPVLPENFSSFVISYCSDGKFWLNGINNDNTVSALYGLHSVGHYIRFLDSSGSALSVEKRYYSTDCQNWTLRDTGTDGLVRNNLVSICFSNIDVYDVDGNLYYSGEPQPINPYILNSAEDLASGSFDNVLIESGDFDLNEGDLYLHTLSPSYNNPSINAYYFTDKVFRLSAHNIYYKEYNYENDIYISYFSISIGDLGIDFKNGNTYYFILNDSSSNLGGPYDTDSPTFSSSYDCRRFTISGLTADDIEYNRHNENIFAINNQTLSIQAQTNAINDQTNKIQEQTNAINNQTNKIEEQTNAINGTTQAVNDTNNFLKDNTVDDTQFDLPTVDVNDPTANFFDTIFMGLYNAVTNNEEKTISLEILGNNINISSADFNYLNGNEWNVLHVILSSMWVFGIGIYILKDIRKMIDKIKDGNVENMATDDIKANMV